MKRILITGANSYIGSSFGSYLQQWPQQYTVDTLDMTAENWQSKSFAQYDVVFHVAGIAHSEVGKLSEDKKQLLFAVNCDLAVATAKKALQEGVKQFIFMSSAIVYGASSRIGRDKKITRDTLPNPVNCYGQSKLKAEEGLRKVCAEGMKLAILRPPMIYGPGCKGNFPALVRAANKLPFFPFVNNRRSMLYIGNLTEFLRLLVITGEGGLFWPQNAEPVNTGKLVQELAKLNNKKIWLVKGFFPLLWLFSFLAPAVNKVFGSLWYEPALSQYEKQYQLFSFLDSLRLTIKK